MKGQLIVPEELAKHYSSYKVEGIQDYISNNSNNNKSNNLQNESANANDDDRRNSSTCSNSNRKRYIRLNPRFNEIETLEELRKDINQKLCKNNNTDDQQSNNNNDNNLIKKVSWLNPQLKFYSIPEEYQLSQCKLYKVGAIYGIDVTSGAVIDALLLQDNNNNTPRQLKVLDLCCAPCNKTSTIIDVLSHYDSNRNKKHSNNNSSIIIGIDNSMERLNISKSIINKYYIIPSCYTHKNDEEQNNNDGSKSASKEDGEKRKSPSPLLLTSNIEQKNEIALPVHLQLYCMDVTTTNNSSPYSNSNSNNLIFDSNVSFNIHNNAGQRKRMNKSAKNREKVMLRHVTATNSHINFGINTDDNNDDNTDTNNDNLFDRVLVDAECSTDGAIRHMRCTTTTNTTNSNDNNDNNIIQNNKLTNNIKLNNILKLQKKLLLYGFTKLQPNNDDSSNSCSIMIYSTCSLDINQNEYVVQWLLDSHKNAYIIPFDTNVFNNSDDDDDDDGNGNENNNVIVQHSNVLKGCIRFIPNFIDIINGMFICKIGKRSNVM